VADLEVPRLDVHSFQEVVLGQNESPAVSLETFHVVARNIFTSSMNVMFHAVTSADRAKLLKAGWGSLGELDFISRWKIVNPRLIETVHCKASSSSPG